MFERTLKVKYITLKNCFCYLSDKYSKVVEQGSVARINYEDNIFYFSLGGYFSSLKENEIGINATYAEILGLEEGYFITYTKYYSLAGVASLDISPCFRDDFEILELMAESIQNTLMNQIRIVNNNQKALIWVSNSIKVIVDIDGVKPVAPGRLEYLTEIAIKASIPKPKDKGRKQSSNSHKWNINDFLKTSNLSPVTSENIFKKYDKFNGPLMFRAYTLNWLKRFVNKDLVFNVYTPRHMLPLNIAENQVNKLFTLHHIPLASENGAFDEGNVSQRNIVVRLCTVEESDYEVETRYFIPLFVDDAILNHYKLTVGAKIILDPEVNIKTASKIQILTDSYNFESVEKWFKSFVAQNSVENKLLLNPNIVFEILNKYKIMLTFSPTNCASLVDSDFIRNGDIFVTKSEIPKPESIVSKKILENICLDCSNFKTILHGCMACFKLGLVESKKVEHILVVGKCGTGKSTIAKLFAEEISSEPFYIHVETVNCKNIKGKTIDSLHKLFTNIFQKLIYYQPSLLILDDIDVICEKVVEADVTQESLLSNKVSEMITDVCEHYLENNAIMLLVTAQSTLKINQNLFSSRGKHLFKNIFSIDEFSKSDRKVFTNYAFSKYSISDDVDIDVISTKTEGYVIQDLEDFVDKCVFESYKEDVEIINMNHCLDALNASSSLSLKNVKLHASGDRDFSDVGGLDDVKKVLIESMMWPAQYTNIFGNSPLRLQSGLLLYGPPGTGKTILAEAAARQCGLRLISIKGPELLSKYIGASEQAVRDVFQKAQSAKPCILFFDEFDSLAPRRGHDNTGVTDRVVNQFLTQLDGVENLTGVCVLAATSRPDLLDPALLRPGRLDRQLLCPLPTKEARLSILKVLSKTLRFAEDVNLENVASVTEGYSGADLQGVLYTAQLTSVERLLSETETGVAISEMQTEIDQCRLDEAVKNTRPSLTRDEQFKYNRIYAKFQGKVDVADIRAGKQRATLA